MEFRAKTRLSRKSVASSLGYSYSYVANIEKGLQPMSARFSKRLASLERKHDGHAFVDVDATVLLTPSAIRTCRCGQRFASNTATRHLCFLCSPPRIKG